MYIYFDTATYDEIERDVKVGEYVHNNHHRVCMKVTIEAQLGLIGGTMGLLTGFSILSGVEIIYYLIRFFFTSPCQFLIPTYCIKHHFSFNEI